MDDVNTKNNINHTKAMKNDFENISESKDESTNSTCKFKSNLKKINTNDSLDEGYVSSEDTLKKNNKNEKNLSKNKKLNFYKKFLKKKNIKENKNNLKKEDKKTPIEDSLTEIIKTSDNNFVNIDVKEQILEDKVNAKDIQKSFENIQENITSDNILDTEIFNQINLINYFNKVFDYVKDEIKKLFDEDIQNINIYNFANIYYNKHFKQTISKNNPTIFNEKIIINPIFDFNKTIDNNKLKEIFFLTEHDQTESINTIQEIKCYLYNIYVSKERDQKKLNTLLSCLDNALNITIETIKASNFYLKDVNEENFLNFLFESPYIFKEKNINKNFVHNFIILLHKKLCEIKPFSNKKNINLNKNKFDCIQDVYVNQFYINLNKKQSVLYKKLKNEFQKMINMSFKNDELSLEEFIKYNFNKINNILCVYKSYELINKFSESEKLKANVNNKILTNCIKRMVNNQKERFIEIFFLSLIFNLGKQKIENIEIRDNFAEIIIDSILYTNKHINNI